MSTETKTTLYEHIKHLHTPRNINKVHQAEQQDINTRIAVALTRIVGSMPTAYIFTVLALIGLFGLLGWLNPFVFLLATWISQQFLQLTLLPVIMVGQNTLSRHSELQANEAFETTMKSYHDTEQIIEHLNMQDAKILEILERLDTQQTRPIRAMMEEQDETCTHPELITLPVSLDRRYDVMCSSCGKTLSLRYSDFLKGVPCVASLVKEEFGSAWEQKAIMWCQCKKHKHIEASEVQG